MSIPAKVIGGGNNSVATNVFRIAFSEDLSAAPLYKAFDNSSTYPAVDAAGTTVVKEAFTGTTGNANKPMYGLVDTTSAAPSSAWLPSSASAGSANPNRLKGDTNYVTSPVTPAKVTTATVITATDSGVAGLPTGAYRYGVTFVMGTAGAPRGESLATTEQTITVTLKQISLTNIPLGPAGCTARKIYRTLAGGATNTKKLFATLADNTTTIYTDNIADGSLGAAEPTVDTTASIRFNLAGKFPYDAAVPSVSSQNILLEVQYQYTGAAPTLTYWYNEGTESVPVYTQFTPGTHGVRPVNASTIAGSYKQTLPASGEVDAGELWVTAN